VRYATGYRPGGPNFVTNDPVTGIPVGPETFQADRLKSYEAGFKADTADKRFGIELAAYYIDWSNIPRTDIARGAERDRQRVRRRHGARCELTLTARQSMGSPSLVRLLIKAPKWRRTTRT